MNDQLGVTEMATYYLEDQPYCITTYDSLDSIRTKLQSLGFVIDYPLQHDEGQVLSGHLFYNGGYQLHVRVFLIGNERYGIRAHYEYAPSRPIRHLICTDLDYEKGCDLLNGLWFQ